MKTLELYQLQSTIYATRICWKTEFAAKYPHAASGIERPLDQRQTEDLDSTKSVKRPLGSPKSRAKTRFSTTGLDLRKPSDKIFGAF